MQIASVIQIHRLRYIKYDEQLFCFVKIGIKTIYHIVKIKNNFIFEYGLFTCFIFQNKEFLSNNIFNVNQHYNKNCISAIRQIYTIFFCSR